METRVATFRFYAELNDFLPKAKQKKIIEYSFSGKPTVKDAIEACGIPHPEVEIILANDISVDFNYHLKDGDRIAVYPEFESLDVSPLLRLREIPLRQTKFIVDTHLGKLARNLRMFGFDVLYQRHTSHQEIIANARQEKRIILTRDQGLLKNKLVTHGFWIRSTDPQAQIRQVVIRLDLLSQIRPFSRCFLCNTPVKPIDKRLISAQLPEKTKRFYNNFTICPVCEKIYWSGSHYQRMLKKIEQIRLSVKDQETDQNITR